jgi:hypothetical protein
VGVGGVASGRIHTRSGGSPHHPHQPHQPRENKLCSIEIGFRVQGIRLYDSSSCMWTRGGCHGYRSRILGDNCHSKSLRSKGYIRRGVGLIPIPVTPCPTPALPRLVCTPQKHREAKVSGVFGVPNATAWHSRKVCTTCVSTVCCLAR